MNYIVILVVLASVPHAWCQLQVPPILQPAGGRAASGSVSAVIGMPKPPARFTMHPVAGYPGPAVSCGDHIRLRVRRGAISEVRCSSMDGRVADEFQTTLVVQDTSAVFCRLDRCGSSGLYVLEVLVGSVVAERVTFLLTR